MKLITWLFWINRWRVCPCAKNAALSWEYSTSPGIGPIISCCSADHLGSGVGLADLNQYFPLPNLLVSATKELSLTSSKLGLCIGLLNGLILLLLLCTGEQLLKSKLRWLQEFVAVCCWAMEKPTGRAPIFILLGSMFSGTLEIEFRGIRFDRLSRSSWNELRIRKGGIPLKDDRGISMLE